MLITVPVLGDTPCPLSVTLEGDADVVTELRQGLDQSGIGEEKPEGCPSSHVLVKREGDQISIVFDDVYGRRMTRNVAETATAASLIESWIRTDTTAGLLDVPARESEPARPAAPPPTEDVTRPSQPAPEPDRLPSGNVGARLEAAAGFDGSQWGGVALFGCVKLKPMCAGALARGSYDLGTGGDSKRLDSRRIGADLLLTGGFPIPLGRGRVMPGIGVGIGWLNISRDNPYIPGDRADEDAGSLRTEVFVVGSWALSRGLSLDAVLAASVSPVAHVGSFYDDEVELAGEPRGLIRLGLGMSFDSR